MFAQSVVNGGHHLFCLLQHFIVPEAQHAIPSRLEKCGSRGIHLEPRHMLAAVNFDDDALLMTCEIHEIWTNGRLPTKMKIPP